MAARRCSILLFMVLLVPAAAACAQTLLGVASTRDGAGGGAAAGGSATASRDGVELTIRSRHTDTLDRWQYTAEVRATSGARVESVEYVFPPAAGERNVRSTAAGTHFRLVKNTYGTYDLKARARRGGRTLEVSATIPAPRPAVRDLAPLSFHAFTRAVDHGGFEFRIQLSGPISPSNPVVEVEYRLHRSFPRNVRHVRDVASAYLLTEVAYAATQVEARVLFADGSIARATIPVRPEPLDAAQFRTFYQDRGNGWFHVSVWLDGSPEALARIESVTYTLHETFPDHVRVVRDRASRFALEFDTVGAFTLRARAGGAEEIIPIRPPSRR